MVSHIKKKSKSFIFRCSFNFHKHVYNYIVPDAKGLQNVLYSTKHRIYQNSKSKEKFEYFFNRIQSETCNIDM